MRFNFVKYRIKLKVCLLTKAYTKHFSDKFFQSTVLHQNWLGLKRPLYTDTITTTGIFRVIKNKVGHKVKATFDILSQFQNVMSLQNHLIYYHLKSLPGSLNNLICCRILVAKQVNGKYIR